MPLQHLAPATRYDRPHGPVQARFLSPHDLTRRPGPPKPGARHCFRAPGDRGPTLRWCVSAVSTWDFPASAGAAADNPAGHRGSVPAMPRTDTRHQRTQRPGHQTSELLHAKASNQSDARGSATPSPPCSRHAANGGRHRHCFNLAAAAPDAHTKGLNQGPANRTATRCGRRSSCSQVCQEPRLVRGAYLNTVKSVISNVPV